MNQEKVLELRKWMQKNEVDLAYVSDASHIGYFSGFDSNPMERVLALFIPLEKDPFLFAPGLEVEDAKASSFEYDVVGFLDSQDPFTLIVEEIKKRYGTPKRIALEKNQLVLDRYLRLNEAFPSADFSADLTPLVQELQLYKTEEECQRLIEAGSTADLAFEIGFRHVKPGVTEEEIVAEIEYELKKKGIKQMSFPTEVLAGPNAASPHGSPGKNTCKENELVLFDLGTIVNGYCSDATRTVACGKPTDHQKDIYNIVLEAHMAAMNAVKPGITCGQLDKLARDVIESHGYGEYFNHRLGHGIGTTIHEFPQIVGGNDLEVKEGMCFSIEPGIYLPNDVGVRIEDCLYVTKDGCIPFTTTSKELITL